MKPTWRLSLVIPLLLPAATIGFMVRDYLRDHGPTGLPGNSYKGHNMPGALPFCIGLVLIETAIAYVVLGRKGRGPLWQRAFATAGLFTPWLVLNALPLLHAGGIVFIHFLWLVVLVIACVALFVAAGLSALVRRRAVSSSHAV